MKFEKTDQSAKRASQTFAPLRAIFVAREAEPVPYPLLALVDELEGAIETLKQAS